MSEKEMFQATPEIRDQVVGTLRRLESDMRDVGVEKLSLFGSIAKAVGDSSDVDLAVTLSERKEVSASDLEILASELSKALGYPADIVIEPVPDAYLQNKINLHRIPIF